MTAAETAPKPINATNFGHKCRRTNGKINFVASGDVISLFIS
jgi:hypothetical protein